MIVEALIERFATEFGDREVLLTRGATFTYAQLAARVTHWRSRVASASWGGGAIGFATDFGFDAIALLLALLAERRTVALLPRDKALSNYVGDACVSEVVSPEGDALEVTRIEQPKQHAMLAALASAGEAGLVIFSSGTAGRPKAALHSIERFLRKFQRRSRAMRTLAFLMFDHVAGQDTLFYTLMAGGSLIAIERRDPQSVLAAIREGRAEVLPTSPTFLRLLCATTDASAADVPSLKVITYGSEPMDPVTLRQIEDRFPQVELVQKYGTTETGAPRTESRGKGSLWIRFKAEEGGSSGVQIRDGVLWLRSAGTLLGYLNADHPLDPDGWYCTGDRVEQDGDWLRILGRVSELINVGGEKVSPSEVEGVIRELERVRDVQVVGEPNALMGNVVAARVVLHDASASAAADATREIRRHCRARLAPFKVPVRIDIVESLAVSPRMKRMGQS